MAAVVWLEEVGKDDVSVVGGKGASLGEMINVGAPVPGGFAVTAQAYRDFIVRSGIAKGIFEALKVDVNDPAALNGAAERAKGLVLGAKVPKDIEKAIRDRYREMCKREGKEVLVAVRSSATAEDLPGASFAGQQDTYLWIRGVDDLLLHARRCISSLFTARAIAYRIRMGFPHEEVALSVGFQKMANSYTAGVMFTLNPGNGDRSVIAIDSNFGFGESVVSGEVTPDHFVVNKVALDILERTICSKEITYTVDPKTQKSVKIETPFERQSVQSLIDEEIIELARMGKAIEKHYGRPMDIEWAVDKDLPAGGNIFILQARPETVWSEKREKEAATVEKATSAMDFILSSLLTGKKVS